MTKQAVANNKTTNTTFICPDGNLRTLTELARHVNVPVSTLRGRLRRKPDAAITDYDWLTRPAASGRIFHEERKMHTNVRQVFEEVVYLLEMLQSRLAVKHRVRVVAALKTARQLLDGEA